MINSLKLKIDGEDMSVKSVVENQSQSELKKECNKLCEQFSDIFKDELGCLKNFELNIKFKEGSSPIFHKPINVPFAIQSDLSNAIKVGLSNCFLK